MRQPILEKYEHEGSPYYSTARLWDDGISIRRTPGRRWRSACRPPTTRRFTEPKFGVFRM